MIEAITCTLLPWQWQVESRLAGATALVFPSFTVPDVSLSVRLLTGARWRDGTGDPPARGLTCTACVHSPSTHLV